MNSEILPRDVYEQMAANPLATCREIAEAGHAPALMSGPEIALVRDWLY